MREKTFISTGMPTTLSEAHLLQLGEVAVNASRLEFSLAEIAAELLDPDPEVGFALTAGMTFERLLSLVKTLLGLKIDDETPRTKFDTLAADATLAMRERNRLLHGHWTTSWNEEIMSVQDDLATRTRRGPVEMRMNVTVEQIAAVAEKLFHAQIAVEFLHVSLLRPLGRLVEFEPGKFRRRS